MKTHKQLFEKVLEPKNLLFAFRDAAKGKRQRPSVLLFENHLARNLLHIQNDLLNHRYKHGPYMAFTVYDQKERWIHAAPFRDRIVHHAVHQIIEPIFERRFIYDSFANRHKKGTHEAVRRIQEFLRKSEYHRHEPFCLKCDVSKCFPSINHSILIGLLKRSISDTEIMSVLREIIASFETGDMYDPLFEPNSPFRKFRPRGIPIGNLTSQLFVNIYLDRLDRFVKHELKVRHYVRYVDDFIILSADNTSLLVIKDKIQTFLRDSLYLELHPKKQRIFPAKLGIDFLGYIIFRDHLLLRKSNKMKFGKRLRKLKVSVAEKLVSVTMACDTITSWLAHSEHADTNRLRARFFGMPLRAQDQALIRDLVGSWKKKSPDSSEKMFLSNPSGQLRLF
jgi:RNA-directed DNA polymerase